MKNFTRLAKMFNLGLRFTIMSPGAGSNVGTRWQIFAEYTVRGTTKMRMFKENSSLEELLADSVSDLIHFFPALDDEALDTAADHSVHMSEHN